MNTTKPYATIQDIGKDWRVLQERIDSPAIIWENGLPEHSEWCEKLLLQSEDTVLWAEARFSVNSAIYAAKYQHVIIDYPTPA